MILSRDEETSLIEELKFELKGKIDGGHKNIISDCPYCGGKGKFGIYIGQEIGRKIKFSSNCFKCGERNRELRPLLEKINRLDLLPTQKIDISGKLAITKLMSSEHNQIEIDDTLEISELPPEYKRTMYNDYLEDRGFIEDDYEYFEVGESSNFKFKDYVIFPIIDDDDIVGYVSRNISSKKDIEEYNREARKNKKYQILRYRNSNDKTGNDFVKLLYNIDNVIEGTTKTVIVVEGIFDVISLTRELELYDNDYVTAVATFGKKISDVQMYKLQQKGVQNIIIGYDPDAVATIRRITEELEKYFNCYVADISDIDKDFGDLDFWGMYDTFTKNLKTAREYRLNKVAQNKIKI